MKNKQAFTLIELLVVVLIIGILAAVALPQYQKAVAKARATEMVHIIDSYQKALDLYILMHGYQNLNIIRGYVGFTSELDDSMLDINFSEDKVKKAFGYYYGKSSRLPGWGISCVETEEAYPGYCAISMRNGEKVDFMFSKEEGDSRWRGDCFNEGYDGNSTLEGTALCEALQQAGKLS